MSAEILNYTGILNTQTLFQIHNDQGEPILKPGTIVIVQAKLLDSKIVHVSIYDPAGHGMICQQIITSIEQLYQWILPLNTNISKALYA